MARHIIEAPDGSRHIIEAPDDASPQDIEAFADHQFKPSQMESFGRGALQGLSLGFGDEIYGAAKGSYDKVLGSGDFSGTYQRERDAVRAANDRAEAENPGSYFAGELAGGIGIPGAAAKAGFKGAQAVNRTLAARSAAAAKEGAAYGAAYGLGQGRGDAVDQAASTAGGLVGGSVLGGALPGVVDATAAALRAPLQAARVLAQPKAIAAEKLSESLSRDAGQDVTSAGPVYRALSRLARSGANGEKNLMLADMGGENTQNLVRSAVNMPNARVGRFNEVLNRRQAVQGRRLSDVLSETLGGGKDYTSAVDNLATSRDAASATNFRQAYNAPWKVKADSDLAKFITERGYMRALLDKTQKTIEGMSGNDPAGMSPWNFLHRVKMEINREVGRLKRGQGDSAQNWTIADLTQLNQEFGRLLAKENPTLGKALRSHSSKSELIDAAEAGREEFFKLSPEELTRTLRGMSRDEADLYRLGAAQAQIEKMRTGDVMRDKTKSIYGSDDIGLRLKAVFPPGSDRGAFLQAVNAARKMAATRRAAQGNSTTAKQLINAQEAGKSVKTMADVAAAASGRTGAIMSLLEREANRFSGMTPRVAAEVLDLAMTKGAGPQVVASSNRAIQEAFARGQARKVRKAQAVSRLLPASGVAASNLAQPGVPLSGGIGPRYDEYGNQRQR